MMPTSILITDQNKIDLNQQPVSNNMPLFLISDEFDLNNSNSHNLFFDPMKKREASNSLEKPNKDDKTNQNNFNENNCLDKNKILSQNISKKGMLSGGVNEGDEINEDEDEMSALVMNSPNEKYIYAHPKQHIKYTLEKWIYNR